VKSVSKFEKNTGWADQLATYASIKKELSMPILSNVNVHVICGGTSVQFIGCVGKYVGAVKRVLGPTIGVSYFSRAKVNGVNVGVKHILESNDTLEFCRVFGVKGNGDEAYELQAARALVKFDPQLQRILKSVDAMQLDKEASICLALSLSRQHFQEAYGPLNGQALDILKGIETHLNRVESVSPAALRLEDAAEYIGVTVPRLNYLTRVRKLRYVKLGKERGRVYRIADLDEFLEENTQLTATEMLRRTGRK